MNISVLGIGDVGLVTATCLAEIGNDVICFDVDSARIDLLVSGGTPIHERGLAELIARNVAFGRLRFTTDAGEAVRHGDVVFIATGTPADQDGSADLQYVLAAARSIGEHTSRSGASRSSRTPTTCAKRRAAWARTRCSS